MTALLERIRPQDKNQSVEKSENKPRREYVPAVDIYETDKNFTVYADVPGADPKTVDITIEKGVLTLTAKVNEEIPVGAKLTYSEYGIGDYRRSFTLSDQIDQDKIEATVKDGVLKIVLPRTEPAVRKIEIRSGE